MAIKLELKKTERILFCGSKWWGDPDMPENMQYPTVEATEDGETFDYPLTFICQINCEDIAALDPEGKTIGCAGKRTFYRGAPFTNTCPPKKYSYAEGIKMGGGTSAQEKAKQAEIDAVIRNKILDEQRLQPGYTGY